MRLVDTSAWIEWLTGSPIGVALTRKAGEDKADQVIAFTETCVVVDLDTAVALSAAEMCVRHKLATADAVVYATALAHGADLLTCDRHFEHLPGILSF